MIAVSRFQVLALAVVALLVLAACGGNYDTSDTNGDPTASGGVPTSAQDDPTAVQDEPTTAQSDPTEAPPEETAAPVDAIFEITSTGFDNGQPIPEVFTCDGDDVSPALDWGAAPPGTVSISLLLLDPDAPGGTFTHWVVANIAADTAGLPEGWDPASSPNVVLGRNDFGQETYGGPCPPRGSSHRYEFRIYALDAVVDFDAGGSASDLFDAMDGHILAESLLVGIYTR